MRLQESGEMYLECILRLSREKGNVRSIDLGEYRGYSKPSISRAVKQLKEGGFISVDENGFISLTPTGRAVAEKIYERHTVLSEFFEELGVEESVAVKDACRIEHVISDESFAAIKNHIAKKEKKPEEKLPIRSRELPIQSKNCRIEENAKNREINEKNKQLS